MARMTGNGPARRLQFRDASVLALDENPLALELLKQVLMGFQMRNLCMVSSVEEAREQAAAKPYDLILLDRETVEIDDADFVKRLRRRAEHPNQTTPVVVISALPAPDAVRRMRDAGADMLVAKPISPAVLLQRIEWIARAKRQFVVSDVYCGPDRRFRPGGPPEGIDERRADAIALTADAARVLSQNDVDSLFG